MLVNIRDASTAGNFSGTLDLSALRLWGERVFPAPVAVVGKLAHGHEQLVLDYTANYTLVGRCSRCLCDISLNESASFSHSVEEDAGEDSDAAPAPGGMLDMAALASSDLMLELTDPPLCKEDCRGLCPQCGADQNTANCGCANQKKVDPRFAALLDYMDD